MKIPSRNLLARLGAGATIAEAAAAAGLSRQQFDDWWKSECAARTPATNGEFPAPIAGRVEILRDRWGIPHILAESDDDLHFAFGWAMAQDRLFQLDYLRRRGAGRLAEILGPEGVEPDLVARTVGMPEIAAREWESLRPDVRRTVERFAAGIDAWREASAARPAIEFDLLDYRPEPWRPLDCLLILVEFRWYLTGRFPVIIVPEMAKRRLGGGPLYEAFLQAEADDEAILPREAYAAAPRSIASEPTGGDPFFAEGSNNWVVDGARTTSGKPMVASDPHIAFGAVSCWYEAHLRSPTRDVAGMTYVGTPTIMFGRNRRVAWGCTNNICSQRDLYSESDVASRGAADSDRLESVERELEIVVRGGETICTTVRRTPRGPIVNEILPGPAKNWEPISLRWLGTEPCGWLTAMADMNRANSVEEFQRATAPWLVPTFCLVVADVEGNIGYQATGRLPLRGRPDRGVRRAANAADAWQGRIPFAGMPHWEQPVRGWIATANNRVAAADFPYPLSGTWSSGYRARRLRELLDGQKSFDRERFTAMQQDALSLRGRTCVPPLLEVLRQFNDDRILNTIGILAAWDFHVEPEAVAPTIFNAFFAHWSQSVAAARFAPDEVALAAAACGGLASSLLRADEYGWFGDASRATAILRSMYAALDALQERLGPTMRDWQWGRIHVLPLKHPLSSRGELNQLLDRGGAGVRGDFVTVCNTGLGSNLDAPTGAGYRLIAELADPAGTLWAIDAGSQSGNPGSPNYDDQFEEWRGARYHEVPLDEPRIRSLATATQTLVRQG